MKKKMLFVRPPAWNMGEAAKKQNIILGTLPYGILSIISYCSKHVEDKVEFYILDLNITPWNSYTSFVLEQEFKLYIERLKPDVVGFSVMYNHMYSYIESLTTLTKTVNKNIVTIVGGACATTYYDKILNEIPTVDAVCYSEGELPIRHMFEATDLKQYLNTHSAFATKETIKQGLIPSSVYIEDLDEIPPLDFSLVNLNLYTKKFSIMRPEPIEEEVCLPIITTRGCPYNCVFCTARTLSGKKVRKASAEKVIRDITELKEKYGANAVVIEDDQFLHHKERAKQILKKIAELKLSLFVAAGFTLSLIDDEIISLMKTAGLQMLTLPIESGSPYIAYNVIKKPIKLETVAPLVEKLRKAGIYCHGNIIIGFPGETEKHRQESINFIKQSGVDWCYVFCATALKGSRLYDLCVENNYIDPNLMLSDGYFASHINTSDFTSKEITEKAYLMNLELNFVHNNNVKRKEYKIAIQYFNLVVGKYSDHAFGHYYLAQCYFLTEEIEKGREHFACFTDIISKSEQWFQYSKYFKLV